MFGAAYLRSFGAPVEPLSNVLGKNSEEFNMGDLVTIDTSGLLVVLPGTTEKIEGIAKKKDTMSASNQTVALVKPPYNPVLADYEFEMDFDAAATQTVVGAYFTITGGTGAQQVSLASASDTEGQVYCVGLDPRGENSVVRGLFRVAKPTTLSS